MARAQSRRRHDLLPAMMTDRMRLYLLFHSFVAPQIKAAIRPNAPPKTTDSGPCAMCHPWFVEPCTAMLMKMVYLHMRRACIYQRGRPLLRTTPRQNDNGPMQLPAERDDITPQSGLTSACSRWGTVLIRETHACGQGRGIYTL